MFTPFLPSLYFFFFYNDPATTEISPFPLPAPFPISIQLKFFAQRAPAAEQCVTLFNLAAPLAKQQVPLLIRVAERSMRCIRFMPKPRRSGNPPPEIGRAHV